MLGNETFVLERFDNELVILMMDKDTKTLWFDVETTFIGIERVEYKEGEYRKVIPPKEYDLDPEEMVPRVFFDGIAALGAATRVGNLDLANWIEENLTYYECDQMDWSMYSDRIEA